MTHDEIIFLRSLNYEDLCKYLKNKYGNVPGDYFLHENCSTPNPKIKRTDDGLFIHHIMENKFPDLSKKSHAIINPFEYQHSENLLYCNYIEHLLLHIRIVKEYFMEGFLINNLALGIGGLINFMFPQIADFYNGYKFKNNGSIKCLSILENLENEIYDILLSYKEQIYPEVKFYCFLIKLKNNVLINDDFTKGLMTKNSDFSVGFKNYEDSHKDIRYETFDDVKLYLNNILINNPTDISIQKENNFYRLNYSYSKERSIFRKLLINDAELKYIRREINKYKKTKLK